MDFQPKYKSDTAMDLFPDGRANRGEIAGTIARGSLNADDAFYRGLDERRSGRRGFPKRYPMAQSRSTTTLVTRGQNRFNIYCTPCHGFDGRGKGVVPQRVKAGGGAWLARNLVEAGRRQVGVVTDAERPALQHDLERLQHDDGLRRADPARGSLGDRPLRPRAPALRRTRAQTTSRSADHPQAEHP